MRILIFAGSHAEAEYWRREHNLGTKDVDYVLSAEWLRGRSTKELPRVYVGTFWDRPDALAIDQTLFVCDLHSPAVRT